MNITRLNWETRLQIFNTALSHSYFMFTQVLDCSISFTRTRCKLSYHEILQKIDYKNNNSRWTIFKRDVNHDCYYEFCVDVSVEGISYFVWIWVSLEQWQIIRNLYDSVLRPKIEKGLIDEI